jgi:hypothetical protein
MALASHPTGPRRRGRRRVATFVFVCALLFGMTAAGSTTRPPLPINLHGPWTTRAIDNEISLSMPTNWEAGDSWPTPGSNSYLIGSFSNQTLVPPCNTTLNGITCGAPLDSLQPGGVLVEIFQDSFFGPWSFSDQPGTPLLVSGLPAKLVVTTGSDACDGLHADRSRIELIAYPDSIDNYIHVAVCSRGIPDAVSARVMDSVHVTPFA